MTAPIILRAAHVAAKWHAGQRRKGAADEPYIGHLLEVAALVAEADETNLDLIVAALLHDVIEDQPVTLEQIAEEFGERVARLVMEATDDKSLPKGGASASRLKRHRIKRGTLSYSSSRTRFPICAQSQRTRQRIGRWNGGPLTSNGRSRLRKPD